MCQRTLLLPPRLDPGWRSYSGRPGHPVSSNLQYVRDYAANLRGWEFSGQYEVLPLLGAVADFNGNYGNLDGAGTRVHTFLCALKYLCPQRIHPLCTPCWVWPGNRKMRFLSFVRR